MSKPVGAVTNCSTFLVKHKRKVRELNPRTPFKESPIFQIGAKNQHSPTFQFLQIRLKYAVSFTRTDIKSRRTELNRLPQDLQSCASP